MFARGTLKARPLQFANPFYTMQNFRNDTEVVPYTYLIYFFLCEILRRGQGLACRLGRCFCILTYAEVSTGDPHPRPTDYTIYVTLIEILRSAQNNMYLSRPYPKQMHHYHSYKNAHHRAVCMFHVKHPLCNFLYIPLNFRKGLYFYLVLCYTFPTNEFGVNGEWRKPFRL